MKRRRFEIENQSRYFPLENVRVGISRPGVKRWAYICHDKDVHEDGTPKEPHYHVMIWLNDSYDSKYVAQWFGVQEQYVVEIKSEVKALEYLTHKNDPQKHQYDDAEVIANFDLQKQIEDEKKKIAKQNRLTEIVEGIDAGTIREYDIHNHVSVAEYDTYKRHIDNAFTYRKLKLREADRQMECVFITGPSGVGKTTYAKQVARDRNFSVFVSSGSNDPLDGYMGQDCIILDDLRPSCIGLSDLLKMLDNNTRSTVKSRYANKVLECRLIIITTTLDISTFFRQVFENDNESRTQLERRCTLKIEMTPRTIQLYMWQPQQQKYAPLPPMPNLILEQYNVRDYTMEEAKLKAAQILGQSADMFNAAKKLIEGADFDQVTMADAGNPFENER